MPNNRVLSKKSPFYLPREMWLTAIHYALQVEEWQRELNDIRYSLRAVNLEGARAKTNAPGDSTAAAAMRAYEIEKKLEKVQAIAEKAAPNMGEWIIKGAGYGKTYLELSAQGMPCGKNYYYRRKNAFYYLLAQSISA